MKKVAFITVTIGLIFIVLSLFFKLNHEDGAGLLLLYGALFNGIIVFPVALIYLYIINLRNKKIYLFGLISAFILDIGIVFEIIDLQYSELVQAIGTGLFILFMILLAFHLYKIHHQ